MDRTDLVLALERRIADWCEEHNEDFVCAVSAAECFADLFPNVAKRVAEADPVEDCETSPNMSGKCEKCGKSLPYAFNDMDDEGRICQIYENCPDCGAAEDGEGT